MAFGAGGPYSLLDTAAPGRLIPNGTSPQGAPAWSDAPDAWDRVYVNDTLLPGTCRVSGSIDMEFDSKKIAGSNGKTHTYLGNGPAKIQIECDMWMPEHLQAFAKLVPVLKPPKSITLGVVGAQESSRGGVSTPQVTSRSGVLTVNITSRNGKAVNQSSSAVKGTSQTFSNLENLAVKVYHPALALYGIHSMVVVSLGLPEMSSQKDVYTVRIVAEEHIAGSQKASGVATVKASIVKEFKGKTARDLRAQQKPSVTNSGPT
jgi:hypothetical protein